MLALPAPLIVAAQDQTPTATFFRSAAIKDVEAASALLSENHPGAAPEMEDTAFRATLESATAAARTRARAVSTPGGYLAVLNGLAVRFGDRHIRTTPVFSIARLGWVGLIIGLRGADWTVVDEDVWPNRAPLLGATLVDCDGHAVNVVANERLGNFRADWSVPAQRGLAAPWLLIDESNPFLAPLKSCRFATAKGLVTVRMAWTPVPHDQIIGRINRATGAGAAGWELRKSGAGWWIALQELTDNAPAVIAAARAHQAELRAAPFVVLDMRGNRGGSSAYGDELTQILYGKQSDAVTHQATTCRESWRVSPDNMAFLERFPSLLGGRLNAEANAAIQSDIASMRQASKAGKAFSQPLHCATDELPPSAESGTATPKTYVLTDRACFSSCLLVVKHFRDLGATQIGEGTNADTWYQEVRDVALPSGLASFSTLSAVDPGASRRVGPYVPEIAYDGDLTDTASVERWVLKDIVPHQ